MELDQEKDLLLHRLISATAPTFPAFSSIPIDALGEMWHGYREKDEVVMHQPYAKSNDAGKLD